MPVTFGATTSLSGTGEWTYPDVGLVIGLLLEVTAAGPGARSWGTEIVRYRDIGVVAPITEAGKMLGRGLYNAEEVTYDIGHGPVGLAYDLAAGTTVNATEILSETPPSGGGGGGDVSVFVEYDSDTAVSVPSGVWTQTAPNLIHYHTDDTVLQPDGSGGINVLADGLYLMTALWFFASLSAMPPNLMAAIWFNGSQAFLVGGIEDPVVPGAFVDLAYCWYITSGTNVSIAAYQDVGSTISVYPQFTMARLAGAVV